MKKLLVLIFVAVAVKLSFSSDYEVILDRVETAFGDNDKVIRFDSLRVKKFNRTAYVLDGSYEIIKPVDDSTYLTLSALNWQGNQYKKIFERSFNNLCTIGYNETFREMFDFFQSHQKIEVPWKTCPYPTGPNELSNYLAKDYADFLPEYMPGNEKWKIELRFLENEEAVGGMNIYAILRNQKSLMMGGK